MDNMPNRSRFCSRGATLNDAGEFRYPTGASTATPHIHGDPPNSTVLRRARLYPRIGVARRNVGPAQALHIDALVIVTPSVYGPDNSATLFGMKARGATAARRRR